MARKFGKFISSVKSKITSGRSSSSASGAAGAGGATSSGSGRNSVCSESNENATECDAILCDTQATDDDTNGNIQSARSSFSSMTRSASTARPAATPSTSGARTPNETLQLPPLPSTSDFLGWFKKFCNFGTNLTESTGYGELSDELKVKN